MHDILETIQDTPDEVWNVQYSDIAAEDLTYKSRCEYGDAKPMEVMYTRLSDISIVHALLCEEKLSRPVFTYPWETK